MRRPKPTREEIRKAYNQRCRLGCNICGHRCQVNHVYGHRFDCCGVVWIHDLIHLEQRALEAKNNYAYAVDRTPRTKARFAG